MKITEEMLYKCAPKAEKLWLSSLPPDNQIPEHPFYMKNTEFIHLTQKIVVLMFENVIVIVIGMILIRKKEIWNVDVE